ncbi:succinylglutamate-semialdehyde dehydrogenase [Enterobacteriaceae bacterium BIT-l23]|uniref:succinylglutamate-semialdehyde dehydrogenase n=1 Tax=Jejubacter sp. L23 TaxID=3092086 RepID=UPI0015845D50|nr:succinylglutamate-semialdehyde dehydrogenase [Enterobacteriaceae bacterium BIT-l23]
MTHWINGRWLPGSGTPFHKTNPVTGETLWQGNGASPPEVEAACNAARAAFPDWARRPLETRFAILERFAALMEQQRDALAQTIARETGKPRWEALTEVTAAVNKIAISLKAWHARTGEQRTLLGDDTAASLRHRPHGVLAVFGPYNFPCHLPNGQIVPALLAGNCVVFKPSELTPGSGAEMVKLWQQAGLPPGALNLVQGGSETGQALAGHPGIDGLLFTGSAATGYQLHRQLAGQPEKILALEMGGNNPLIVDQPDDIDGAVHLTIQSAFITAGQRCTCARRLLVKRGAAGDRFLERLVTVAERLRPAAWYAEPQPFMGGVISRDAAQRVMTAWRQHLARGGRPLLAPALLDEHSSLVAPGIVELTGVTGVPDEEVFGPLLGVWRYDNFDEAIALANATRYGLSAGLISPDRALFDRLLLEARAGIVNWNRPLTGAASTAPFGGMGASGNHRPGAWYMADACAWPMASLESERCPLPQQLSPGLDFSGGDDERP